MYFFIIPHTDQKQKNKIAEPHSATKVKPLTFPKQTVNKKSPNEGIVFPELVKKWYQTNYTSNVLLLSSGRSGGAFLGQLLNDIFPDTFYAFLPTILAALYQVSHI